LSARSAHEAIKRFLDPLNLAVSCVSRTPIQQTFEAKPQVGRMSFQGNEAVRLNSRHNLSLQVFHAFEVSADHIGWRVRSRAYMYHVYAGEEREIIAFHWHPDRGPVALPHAHFKTLNDPFPMGKAHMPTGRVSLESVIRLLIDELAVEPMRRDWRGVLAKTERAFIEQRSWHNLPSFPGSPSETRQST
jgi:hypothetical protein